MLKLIFTIILFTNLITSKVVENKQDKCYVGKYFFKYKDKGLQKIIIHCENDKFIALWNVGDLIIRKNRKYKNECKVDCYGKFE